MKANQAEFHFRDKYTIIENNKETKTKILNKRELRISKFGDRAIKTYLKLDRETKDRKIQSCGNRRCPVF